jgi:C1A family cysteine protease
MQLPVGIVRSILLSIICFYFLILPVCAGITTPLVSPPNINSSPVMNITTIPITISTQIPALELVSASTPGADISSSPSIKSSVIPVTNNNQHLAPINPDFIAYKKSIAAQNITSITDKLILGSSQVSKNVQRGLGFIPPITDLSYIKGQDVSQSILSNPLKYTFPINAGPYPTLFDLRTLDKVTPVRDQWSAGSCWAQATYASLESYLLPAESWDFSENNMKNLLSSQYPEGFDRAADDGGNAYQSTAYLARWTGPINETDDPYDPFSNVSPTGISAKKHVQNVLFLPDRSGPEDNENIKSALMTYGVVYTSMYYHPYFENITYYPSENYTTAAYYFNGSTLGNHAVGIVGWDDNYSRYNFTEVPPDNGAFIIKNSWGTSWGEEGYFYVSYYDSRIGLNNAVFTAESAQNYDNIYQYDPLGWIGSFGAPGNTEWGANVFQSNSSETLSAISFYAVDTNTSYEFFIYKNPDDGPVNTTGYSYRENGTLSGPPGYYSKVITPGVTLQDNDTFSVVMNLTTKNYPYPLPIEYAANSYSSQATAHAGESFFSEDGGQTWSDMTSYDSNANICIKAFTTLFTTLPEDNIGVFRNSTGTWYLETNKTGIVNKTFRFGLNGDNSVIGDWNKDGISDVGVFRNSTGTWYLETTKTGIVNKTFRFGITGDIPVVGDWNNDGISDVGVFRNSTGTWYLETTKTGVVNKTFRFGITGDIPVVGDWNNDGISDVGVFRNSTGTWYLETNKTGIVNKTFRFGITGDIPVVGDWNNDGISDVGVFRNSTGTWYLETNKTGIVNKTFRFGLNGDLPVVADFNGDGTSDIAVYRPSNGNWYLDYNLNGGTDKIIHFGLNGDSPVVGKWS